MYIYIYLILIIYMNVCRYLWDNVKVSACSFLFSGWLVYDQDETTGLWHLADVNSPDLGKAGVNSTFFFNFFPTNKGSLPCKMGRRTPIPLFH